MTGHVIEVCMTCSDAETRARGGTPLGRRFFEALRAEPAPEGVTVRSAPCLAVCARPATVALRAAGKIVYVFGGLTDGDAPALLRCAALYRDAPDGDVPYGSRPPELKGKLVVRLPALEE
ncbi:MAG TPA: DUF1636 domain-containing protein [Azospirillaceae bacterium]|nr:DUF1636 domain-containing protein [Azospirillaceae bacterium]